MLSLYFALWSSIANVIIKRLTLSIHPVVLFLVGNLFMLPFMLLILITTGGIPTVSSNFFKLMFASSILDTIAFSAAIWSIKLAPISLVAPISSFNPVFVTIISAFALKEIPTPLKFLGIMIVVLGAYLLNLEDYKRGFFAPIKDLLKNRGVQLAFLANFLWGFTPIFQKPAIFQTHPVAPLFVSFFGIILTAFFILPFALKNLSNSKTAVSKNLKWFLIIAVFGSLSQWAALTAFSLTNVGYATSIFKLSTLFTVILGALFFKEKHIKERLLGALVMILGTLLLVI